MVAFLPEVNGLAMALFQIKPLCRTVAFPLVCLFSSSCNTREVESLEWPMNKLGEPALAGILFLSNELFAEGAEQESFVVFAVWKDDRYVRAERGPGRFREVNGVCASRDAAIMALSRIGDEIRRAPVQAFIHPDVNRRHLFVETSDGACVALLCDDDMATQIETLAKNTSLSVDELGGLVAKEWSSRFVSGKVSVEDRYRELAEFAVTWALCWRQMLALCVPKTESVTVDGQRTKIGRRVCKLE